MSNRDEENSIFAELEAIRWEITAEYPTPGELCDYLRSLEPRYASQMVDPAIMERNLHPALHRTDGANLPAEDTAGAPVRDA
ncbi:hypothetical protein [Longimicrobium terrae]|uniref:Uncharacterized protein n=1 Tax=Longimicrobium terrae TaxID=1639882 RepID=A0A841H3D3_9BACT|nr:hypothetical protein [Longimicrobium terrae]MBB4638394.1 hypothetical protein [Longimicrobium terrae]MBB6072537.1 hypothetical protein [Longimicrobium terrae]NNC28682.1 hypothetical protein [Longimicrobium terrae]